MIDLLKARKEASLTLRYSLTSVLGFLVDISLLRAGIHLHLSPAIARSISLISAMQATFLVNGLIVFACLTRANLPAMWIAYMGSNAVGNLCNYLTFTTLLSLHQPVLSDHLFAVAAGGLIAWVINYGCARFVFGKLKALAFLEPATGRCPPTPTPIVEG